MKIVECEQGSVEWFWHKAGLPSASNAAKILTSQGKRSASRVDYIYQLLAESVLPGVQHGFSGNKYTQDGTLWEPEARKWYEFERDVRVQQVGWVLSEGGKYGCSPDGLVQGDGGLEVKCPTVKVQIKRLDQQRIPSEYKPQVHFSLVVSGRAWWDFLSYSAIEASVPHFLIRVEPDDYTLQMADEIEAFCGDLAEARKRILPDRPPKSLNEKMDVLDSLEQDRMDYDYDPKLSYF